MRALVLSNMLADAGHPERGSFVRDQVDALCKLEDWSVELYEFAPGARALAGTVRDLRKRYAGERFDVVHAHFGLTAWPALAARGAVHAVTLHGTDLADRRSRPVTLAGLRLNDLVAVVSEPLAAAVPRWAMSGRGMNRSARCSRSTAASHASTSSRRARRRSRSH